MEKRAFLKTAIEVLKYDDKFKKIEKREILIKLLSRSSVNFLPQWGFEYLQRIKTLLHETAYAYDFAMNPNDDIPRNRRELIAESVAFVISMRLGLDTSSYSMGYIQS